MIIINCSESVGKDYNLTQITVSGSLTSLIKHFFTIELKCNSNLNLFLDDNKEENEEFFYPKQF